MKLIIDRKIYDTETAIKLAGISNNVGRTSHLYYEEYLYKTVRGTYFLFTEGFGNIASTITPLNDEEQAIQWLEAHDQSKLLELFPDKVEEA